MGFIYKLRIYAYVPIKFILCFILWFKDNYKKLKEILGASFDQSDERNVRRNLQVDGRREALRGMAGGKGVEEEENTNLLGRVAILGLNGMCLSETLRRF